MSNQQAKLTYFHAPWSRSAATRWLLEELGLDYEVRVIHFRSTVPEDYRAIQPHKKVPAIVDGATVITERAAIAIYLADKFIGVWRRLWRTRCERPISRVSFTWTRSSIPV